MKQSDRRLQAKNARIRSIPQTSERILEYARQGQSKTVAPKRDHVDRLVEEWHREKPDLDVSPMVVVARLSRLSRIFDRKVEEVYATFGLNQPQFAVLAALRRAGPPYRLTPTELRRSLLVTSGAITNRLDRLSAAGLIVRVRHPDDGRRVQVALTPAGMRMVDAILVPHYDNERRLLAPLLPKDRARLAALLRRLLLAFEGSNLD